MRNSRIGAVELADLLGVHRPTEEQRAIIESPLESAVVIAGAGSGKTTVISLRVVWLVANGLVAPERVLGLTFTRKAVGELNERVRSMLTKYRAVSPGRPGETAGREQELPGLDLPLISTYNSYAASLVADHGIDIGLEAGDGVIDAAARQELVDSVLDRATSADVVPDRARSTMAGWVSQLLGEMGDHLVGFDEVDRVLAESAEALCTPDFLRGLAAAVRRRRSGEYQDTEAKRQIATQIVDAADLLESADRGRPRSEATECARRLLEAHEDRILPALEAKRRVLGLARRYAEAKWETGGMEFSDQVAHAHRIMTTSDSAPAAERSRWDIVLLDEYQDTSYSQFLLLSTLFARMPVMAVGDPRQAIYGWRGASADNIESFPSHFRGPADTAAAKYGLMTSWRNDTAILTAANRIALGLDSEDERQGLAPRPGSGPGEVTVSLTHSAVRGSTLPGQYPGRGSGLGAETDPDPGPSQLEELVGWALEVRAENEDASIAVLCRNRSGFGHVAAALEEAGLPVEAVGVRGVLDDPFVVDTLAALEVLVDPDAGNVLMRLLTGRTLRLGAGDVRGFADFVRTRAVTMPGPDGPGTEVQESIGLVEGLDELLQTEDGPDVRARGRLVWLSRALRRLRGVNLTLTGLVRAVVRELGIDTEIAALSPPHQRVHTRALDGFLSVVSGFVADHPAGSAKEFLDWLRLMSEADEMDEATIEPDPGAITVMTVHASKGLEFDAVAVPFMHDGGLPGSLRSRSGWLSGGALPYPLRGDRGRLPAFDLRSMDLESPSDFTARMKSDGTVGAALEAHHRREERRLAYVALTRARKRLFVSASRHTIGRTKPVEEFPFLTEVAEALGTDLPALPAAEPAGGDDNPAAMWPAPDPAPLVQLRADRLAALRAAQQADPSLEALSQRATSQEVRALAARALQLLAEESAAGVPATLPARMSATAMVGLSSDAARWWADQQRPMPEAPSTGAELGTAFHAWVEQHYGQAALLDIEAGETAARVPAGTQETLARLKDTFLASGYARLSPAAVELSFELVLDRTGGRPALHVPGKIDAVFVQDDGGVLVVDWKTGRRPVDPERLRHMEVQLAVYRAALMRMPVFGGAPRVDAELYFVGSDETWRPERLMDEGELVGWLDAAEERSVAAGAATRVHAPAARRPRTTDPRA